MAIEYPTSGDPSLQAYVASDGTTEDRSSLLASQFWNGFQDGRESKAMLVLIDRLRAMQQAGRIAGVIAAQPDGVGPSGEYEQRMAGRWIAAAPTETPIVALVGNVHAMTEKIAFGDGEPEPRAAYFLPAEGRITINTDFDGGSTWACFGKNECGPHELGKASGNTGEGAGPSVTLAPSQYFDGTLDLHGPISASPPAVESVPNP